MFKADPDALAANPAWNKAGLDQSITANTFSWPGQPPWTLPSNLGLTVGPQIEYVLVFKHLIRILTCP